jgi:lysylphosphatidylglycerol synthetase-like protein (DUF2156 family)
LLFALEGLPFLPMTEAASATAPVTAPVAVFATLRTTRLVTDGFALAVRVVAGLAVALRVAVGLAAAFRVAAVFGAVLADVFLVPFDRAAAAGPAPVFDCVALLFLGAAFFALVAMALFLLAERRERRRADRGDVRKLLPQTSRAARPSTDCFAVGSAILRPRAPKG